MNRILAKERSGKSGASRARKDVKSSGSGVVDHYVRVGKQSPADKRYIPSRLIGLLRAGLPVEELDRLRDSLGIPMESLIPLLQLSKATLHRRKAGGRLEMAVSDRIVRYARLMGKAVEVLESEDAARRWLTSPQIGLGGEVPLVYAETEVGAREVEDLLGRIEYGVYS